MLLYKAFARLNRSRTRSALTVFGIAIGVFSVVLISSISAAGSLEISKTLNQMGMNSLLVQSTAGSYAMLDDSDIQSIKQLNGVRKAMPLMAEPTKAKLRGNVSLNPQSFVPGGAPITSDCFAWGITQDAAQIISLEAKHGRLIHHGDTAQSTMVCVIDEDIALKAYGRSNIIGKTARLSLNGSFYDFEIVGVAKSGISSLQTSFSGFLPQFVYLPLTTMQMLSERSHYDKIAVLTRDGVDGNSNLAENIEKKLSATRAPGIINATDLMGQKSQLERIIGVITLVLTVIAGISLLVSSLSVMTVMLSSVKERAREIGIKKAIGARGIDICLEFLTEAGLLSLTGSTIGAIFSLITAYIGCLILRVSFVLDLPAVIAAIAISLLFGMSFGVYPAGKAAKLPPIKALSNS